MDFCKDALNQFTDALKQYANFEGKATRKQFWMFVLVCCVIGGILGAISSWLSWLFSLAILVPSLAIGARRLHDINKSGWLQLLLLIPFIGALILIFAFWIKPSEKDAAAAPSENA
ncbi:MAG: DUF805 domain-containing protein [Lentisphaeria bacterium]|nr:DUF805 domain-containing protein [Lentisphaeria bacterium]